MAAYMEISLINRYEKKRKIEGKTIKQISKELGVDYMDLANGVNSFKRIVKYLKQYVAE